MLEYERRRYPNGGMQQQLREEEMYHSTSGYHHESEFSQSQMQVCAPPRSSGFLRPGSNPHKNSGWGGHSHSSGHHSSGGGMLSHIGAKLNPAKFHSGGSQFHGGHGGGYHAGGMASGEYEREHSHYEYQSLPSGMYKKERYESDYANHGAGMGHGSANFGGMCGPPKAEWVSKGL